MESIQLAQMLADLSDINTAESHRAVALVSANKTLGPTSPSADSATPSEQPNARPGHWSHQRTVSTDSAGSGALASRAASPAKFDKFGRRILTPPNTRTNSTYGSIPGTPREIDEDVDRANSLMTLYDIRAKLKDQDNRGLHKLREKVAALHARQQAEKRDTRADGGRSKFSYPKNP